MKGDWWTVETGARGEKATQATSYDRAIPRSPEPRIADSAQFSASVSELAEKQRVGSALALQTALGFLLTAVSIQVLPFVVRGAGWRAAFVVLAVGPALGAVAMLRLRSRPEAARLPGGRR
jgi:hypothetical protein